jgi:phage FluMu protein Com
VARARFAPCPHCAAPLSYLEGVSGSTLTPKCPRCREVVSVPHATFLMADNSRPSPKTPRDDVPQIG